MYKIIYKVSRADGLVTRYECSAGHIFDHYDFWGGYPACCHACERIQQLKQIEEENSIKILGCDLFECTYCGLEVNENPLCRGFSFECGCQARSGSNPEDQVTL